MSYIEEALEKAKALAKQAKLNSDISQVCLTVFSQTGAAKTRMTTGTSRDINIWCYHSFLGTCLFVCLLRELHGLPELLVLWGSP